MRGAGILGKQTLIHDEAISYLSATGHQGEYGEITKRQSPPFGTWAKASEWKRFVQPEDSFCFKRIRDDLAHFDIHPPLYFWLLHVWCLLIGVHIWTGPTLNLVLFVPAILGLYGMSRRVLHEPVSAALVALVWSVSPNVILSTLEARQYDLLALFTILLVWNVIRCSSPLESCGLRQLAPLTLITAGGMLTHYHFPLLLVGGGLFALVRLARNHRKRFAVMCAAVGVGIAIFVLVHPRFLGSVNTAGRQAQAFRIDAMDDRLDRVLTRYTAFFMDGETLPLRNRKAVEYVVLVVIVAMFLKVGVSCVRGRAGTSRSSGETKATGAYVLYFLLWTALGNILLYVTFLAPRHAMAAKYPAMVWPFYAFVPVLALTTFRRTRLILTVAVCLGMLFAGVQRVRATARYNQRFSPPVELLERTRNIVVDNVGRGWLPRVLWFCPGTMNVFAADQEVLLERTGAWLDHLSVPALYVSPLAEGSTDDGRRSIREKFAGKYRVAQMRRLFWDLGPGFWVLPRE